MNRELLRQALDYIKETYDFCAVMQQPKEREEQLIKALETELAKPEQEPEQDTHCKHCNGIGCVACDARCLPEQELARPEQEPVAWMVRDQVDGCRYPSALKNPAGSINGESQPLYTALPRKELAKPEQEPTLFFGRAVYFADPRTGEILPPPDLSIEANRVAYDVAMHYANKTREKLG